MCNLIVGNLAAENAARDVLWLLQVHEQEGDHGYHEERDDICSQSVQDLSQKPRRHRSTPLPIMSVACLASRRDLVDGQHGAN